MPARGVAGQASKGLRRRSTHGPEIPARGEEVTRSRPAGEAASGSARFRVAASDPMADAQGSGGSRFGWRTPTRLRLAFERSRNPMLFADDQRRWVNGNAAASDLLGIAREEIPWHTMDDFTPPSEHRRLQQQWTGFLAGGAAEGWYQLWVESRGAAPRYEFSATANVLPSRHLAVFVPPDELSPASAEPASAPWSVLPDGRGLVLTPREREVMTLLAAGLKGGEIAQQLVLSPETIKSHVQNALVKLDRRTRAGGVAVALVTGQIDLES